ncbi:MAG TPA: hypothetical protein VGL28_11510 [Steroidobacteraceae bacterium]
MKRRYFLISALAGAFGLAALRYAFGSDQGAIAKVVFKKLSYLKLDPAGVRQFAHDLARTHAISDARLRLTDALGPLYTLPALSSDNRLDNAIRHGEDRITTLYLLSTDFFKNGADESREVKYLSLYDALVACSNPFARPVIPPTSA